VNHPDGVGDPHRVEDTKGVAATLQRNLEHAAIYP
jgi:hypothetical protein